MGEVGAKEDALEAVGEWVEARLDGRRGGCPVLFVTGSRSGRTPLLERAADEAGDRVLRPEPRSRPWALADALLATVADGDATIDDLLPTDEDADLPPGDARLRLFERIAARLAEGAPETLVVCLPDITKVSEDDVDLLAYLARGATQPAPPAAEVELAPVRLGFLLGIDMTAIADESLRAVIRSLHEEGVARRVDGPPGEAEDSPTRQVDAPDDLAEAADRARRRLALREAHRLYDIVTQAGPELATPDRLVDYGEVLLSLGRPDRAREVLERAADALAEVDGGADLLDRVAVLLATVHRRQAMDEEADEVLRGRLGLEPPVGPPVLVAAIEARLDVGRVGEAADLADRALDEIPPGDHAARARAFVGRAGVAMDMGDDRAAEEAYRQAHEEARQAGDAPVIARAANARAIFARGAGRDEEAAELYREAVSARARAGDLRGAALSLENLSKALRNLDRAGEARPVLRAALAIRVRLGEREEAESIRRQLSRMGGFREEAVERAETVCQQDPPEIRRELVHLYTLQEITRVINLERDPQRVLNLIIDHVIELLGAERGFLLLKTEEARAREDVGFDDIVFEVARNMDRAEIRSPRSKLSSSIALEVLRSGRPVLTGDASADERWEGYESVADLGLRSVLCIPFVVRGSVLGAVYVDNPSARRAFTASDQRLLEAFADQAAVAIENAWLFDENQKKQRELERLNRNLVETVASQSHEIEGLRAQLEATRDALETRFDYEAIIGEAERMQEVFRLLDKVIPTDVPVLVQGESGTGKELVAKAIHFNGPRKGQPFIGENCAAITDQLLESELFGHVKGAFTGAESDKSGIFERADGGTVFLDEVGDMSPKMQKDLLRVLEEHEVRRVGGKEIIPVDVRLVSATNRDLQALVETGDFRRDLYYRLNVFTIQLPPLRERKGDIPRLVDHFLEEAAASEDREPWTVQPEAMKRLMGYHWPGNIRELRNVIDRARTMATGDEIEPDDLGYLDAAADREGPASESELFFMEFQDAKDQFTRDYLRTLLERNEGHVTNSARESGMLRQSFHRLLRRHDIDPDEYRD